MNKYGLIKLPLSYYARCIAIVRRGHQCMRYQAKEPFCTVHHKMSKTKELKTIRELK